MELEEDQIRFYLQDDSNARKAPCSIFGSNLCHLRAEMVAPVGVRPLCQHHHQRRALACLVEKGRFTLNVYTPSAHDPLPVHVLGT